MNEDNDIPSEIHEIVENSIGHSLPEKVQLDDTNCACQGNN